MGLLGFLKSNPAQPQPRLRLMVFCAEEALPCPLQLAHPDGLGGAPRAIPSAQRWDRDPQLLVEQSMEPGDYLFRGLVGTVAASVVQRHRSNYQAAAELRRGVGRLSGMDAATRQRVEGARWSVSLRLTEVRADPRDAVLFQMEIADRMAKLAEGVVLDQEALRYYLPGKWRIPGSNGPLDVRQHLSFHLEAQEDGKVWVHTHGLCKFGRPELEVRDLPGTLGELGRRFVVDLSQRILDGAALRPGDTVGDRRSPLVLRAGSDAAGAHFDLPTLELVDGGFGRGAARRGATSGIEAWGLAQGHRGAM